MPPVVIQDIEINEKHGIIRVGTFGRGIWECRIP
jgi:hypothetical protein